MEIVVGETYRYVPTQMQEPANGAGPGFIVSSDNMDEHLLNALVIISSIDVWAIGKFVSNFGNREWMFALECLQPVKKQVKNLPYIRE
jgi:hypothetical protein